MKTATAVRRSLLDPPPRRSRGMTRDMGAPRDREIILGSARHYRELMAREFPDAPCPTFGDIVQGAYGFRTCADDGKKTAIIKTLQRTMTGLSGPVGGFALATGMAADIFDRARTTVGPWSLCEWIPADTREYLLPITAEASRANGSRWGGVTATWGYGETTLPPATQGTLAQINSVQNRLLIYMTPVSRDLWGDARRIQVWLKYVGLAEIRYCIENAMVNGSGPGGSGSPGPQGVLDSAATVIVTRAVASQIAVADVTAMWKGVYSACKERAVWHASATAIEALDKLNASGQFPVNLYFPAGSSPMGTPYATIFGKPVIPLESCPPLGTPGDLFVCDWSQYALTYMKLNTMDSPLSFDIQVPNDSYHRGMVGMPIDAVEARVSDERFFDTDALALVFKFRGDGNFLWPKTMTDVNANTVGPCAILSA